MRMVKKKNCPPGAEGGIFLKILIISTGTMGDVQPYIGLAQKLQSEKYDVCIASAGIHKHLIEENNICFFGLDNSTVNSHIQQVASEKGLTAVKKGIELMFEAMDNIHMPIMQIINDYDLVIGHGWFGETEAEISKKKFIRVGTSPNLAQKKALTLNPLARAQVRIEKTFLNKLIIAPYNEFRKKINAKEIDLEEIYSKPLLLPIPNILIKSKKGWGKNTYQTPYWYVKNDNAKIPSNLQNLIDSSKKKVLVSFGSMNWGREDNDRVIKMFYNCAKKLDFNLIWVGEDNFDKSGLDNERFGFVPQIPYEIIFPHVDVVFHHCGLGTTCESLRSGVPVIPVPHIIDQFGWANKLNDIGVSTKMIPIGNLDEKIILQRIKEVFFDKNIVNRCSIVKESVQKEIKEDKTVSIIKSLII